MAAVLAESRLPLLSKFGGHTTGKHHLKIREKRSLGIKAKLEYLSLRVRDQY